NPTLADLAQSPYSPLFGQGVCDLRQACGVGDISKTISLLVKAMPALRAWQATYSWPFKITWAGKGGCPLTLMVRWPQSGSRMCPQHLEPPEPRAEAHPAQIPFNVKLSIARS